MTKKKHPVSILQEDIKKLLEKGVSEGIFPSGAGGIVCGLGKEKKEIIFHCGNASIYPEKRKLKKDDFFDLASLTKPLATTLALLCLLKAKKINIEETLGSLLGKKVSREKSRIRIKNLLNHSSGLPAYRPYFAVLKDLEKEKRKEYAENLILQEKLEYKTGTKCIYSDLGFILLGRIIELKAECPLDRYVEEMVLGPLRLEKNIFFMPLFRDRKDIPQKDFAATEDCPWRKKILCGEVHDDNCYAMGGVAGHSGLFGNIAGVTRYVGFLLDMWKGAAEHPHINKEDLVRFLARPQNSNESSWTLGFDTPSPTGSSSGCFFSKKSVGHLGFTGTSFWIDPEKDAAIVLLSNRVHPSRENVRIRQFRPYFHDRLMEKIFPPGKNFFMAESKNIV